MAFTAAPEEAEHFPSVDEVLNKLKSNGTFDLFRKTCLASVQAEPSFRAYGEHIEVVARRYLQNFKWRDNITKNQVRSRLKDHALGVIESPDIQVGVPFSLLVEKAMETKGKELLPKIMEVVDTLRLEKPIHVQTSEPSTNIKCQEREENSIHKAGLDFDLSLPIDLPGLVSSGCKRDSVESASKSVKSKQKLVDSNIKGGVMKVKTQISDGNTLAESLKDVKIKEKDKEGSQLADGKKDGKAKTVKPKKVKEEMEEKDSLDKQKDAGITCVEGTSGKSEKEKSIKEVSDKKYKHGDGASNRKETVEEMSERQERGVERTSDRKLIAKEIKSEENSRDCNLSANSSSCSTKSDDDKKKSEHEKKPLPSRRSARLVSLTEEQDKDEPSDVDELVEDQAEKQQLSEDEFEVRACKIRRNRKRKVHISGRLSQKRAKAYLDSSSENSGEELYHSTKREANEELQQDTKKSFHRKRPYKPDQEIAMDFGSAKRAKTLSRTASPASTCSNSSALMIEGQGVHHRILEQTKSRKRKTNSLQRLPELSRDTSKSPIQSPPPPIVGTRSNHHVKPNRRYYDNMSEEEMECEVGDSSGPSEVEENAMSVPKKNSILSWKKSRR